MDSNIISKLKFVSLLEHLKLYKIVDIENKDLFRKVLDVGDIIRLKDGRVYLVGNVNDLGGLCDCCPLYHNIKCNLDEIEIANISQLIGDDNK